MLKFNSKTYFLSALFILSFLLRLFYTTYTIGLKAPPQNGDSIEYDNIAQNILHGNGIVKRYDAMTLKSFSTWPNEYSRLIDQKLKGDITKHTHGSYSFRLPIYPLFLAVNYTLLFKFNLPEYRFALVRILQALLSAFTVVLVFLGGRKVFSQKVGYISSTVISFDLYLIRYAGYILAETLTIFLLLLSILFLMDCHGKKGYRNCFIGGFLLGITILTRGNILFFPFFFTIWLTIVLWGRKKELVKRLIIFWVGVLIVLSPWSIRNSRIYGELVFLSTQSGSVFAGSNNILTAEQGEYLGGWYKFETAYPDANLGSLSEVELDKKGWELGFKFLKESPGKIPKLLFYKFVRFTNPVPLKLVSKMILDQYELEKLLSYLWLFPFIIYGIILSIKQKNNKAFLLILLMVSYTIMIFIFYGSSRFRTLIIPYLIIFAASGIYSIIPRWYTKLIKQQVEI